VCVVDVVDVEEWKGRRRRRMFKFKEKLFRFSQKILRLIFCEAIFEARCS